MAKVDVETIKNKNKITNNRYFNDENGRGWKSSDSQKMFF